MKLKNTIIKNVTAIICVGALCFTVVSSTGKICDAKTAGLSTDEAGEDSMWSDDTFFAEETGGDASTGEAVADTPTDSGTTDGTATADDGTAAPADDSATGDSTATDNGTTANNGSTTGGATTKAASTGSNAPSTVAEIVAYYNNATANAAKKTVPFSKSRTTVEKSFTAGATLSALKSTVYKFMGTGDANKFSQTITSADKDSYYKYLQASKLTTADVTKASCTTKGSNYCIALYIKSGSSSVKDGKVVSSNNAPLDRSGLACGDNDKDYWDHKTAENIMAAIDEVPGCTKANISESYDNAAIAVVINSTTGNIVSLKATFTFKFELSSVMGSKGNAEAQTVVAMTDFKY